MPATQYLFPGHLTLSGQARLFGPTSPWNTVKDQDPTFDASADTVLSTFDVFFNNGDFCHPVYEATGLEADVTIHLGLNEIGGATGGTLVKPAPSGMHPAAGSDGVMFIAYGDGTWIDLYGVTRNSDTDFDCDFYVRSDQGDPPAGDIDVATGFGNSGNFQRAGTTGIGSAQAGGTIRKRDVDNGTIPHGIFVAGTNSFETTTGFLGDGASGDLSVLPAVGNDIGSSHGPIPEGALLQIPADAELPVGLTVMEHRLFIACQTYGAIVCDQTGSGQFFTICGDGSDEVNNAMGPGIADVCHLLRLVDNFS